MTRYQDASGEWYLLTYSTNEYVTLKRSKTLMDDWDRAEETVVFNPDPESRLLWATDLRIIPYSQSPADKV